MTAIYHTALIAIAQARAQVNGSQDLANELGCLILDTPPSFVVPKMELANGLNPSWLKITLHILNTAEFF